MTQVIKRAVFAFFVYRVWKSLTLAVFGIVTFEGFCTWGQVHD